jgi:CRISPR/Cas system-associated exonuclease Cas4 (RecB family)
MTLLVLAGIAGALWFAWTYFAIPAEQRWMPRELRRATRIAVEQEFACVDPTPLIARPDQVFELRNGALVVSDLKIRDHNRIYNTDVAQLSLDRLVLQSATGRLVAAHGYILIRHPITGTYLAHRISLWSETRTQAIVARYQALRDQAATPVKANQRGKCANCGHRRICRPEL